MNLRGNWLWPGRLWCVLCLLACSILAPSRAFGISYFEGWSGHIGLGGTYLRIHQSTLDQPVRQYYLTAKGGLRYAFPDSIIEFSANAFGSIYHFRHIPSQKARADVLGYNIRGSLRFSHRPSGWFLRLTGGVYTLQTTVAGQIYGISNLVGPQGIVSIHQKWKKRSETLSFYVKYAPIASKLSQLNLLYSREAAAGMSVQISNWRHRPPAYLNIDYSSLNIRITGVPAVTVRSMSVGVSLGF